MHANTDIIFLPHQEPVLDVSCSLGAEGVTAECTSSLDNTTVELNYSCSYNDGPPLDCERTFL